MATECRQCRRGSLDFGTIAGRSVVGASNGGVKAPDLRPGIVRELKSTHIALREREIAPYQGTNRRCPRSSSGCARGA